MEKLNDYFLNLLSNPTFTASDFTLVGLSVDNTSILDKNVYLNSNYIKELDVFKTNGTFDKSKFDNFYDYAKSGFNDLAKIKENDDLGNTWRAYRNDISMPENLRDNSPQFKIQKVQNPLRQQEGFVTFGLKENPTQSIREIALSQQVWDPETNSWKDSPNDTPFDNFLNPKVLATWDEDGEHKDPITGVTVSHKKGDRKLNSNGTYYYENLGNRSIYGKEVLSAFDTLTTDGSSWNKLDFLDSDDIEKSTGGSLMRAAAQIVPAFIPGVGEWYIAARVGLGLGQILPAIGKTLESFTGYNTSNSLFNKLEAWDKALSFSQSDYTQGSLTDEGQILQDSHLWSMETGLKLIADVFTLLAELRWMFERGTSLFSGLNKEVVYSKEALLKWMEDYIAKNTSNPTLEDILKGISKGVNPETTKLTALNVNWIKALKALEGKLKGAQELGSKLSMAYMTGITTASSYGEAKEQGASDLEAALFTLGYTFGEWKLLNSELGKWILPELKSERKHIETVVSKAIPEIKLVTAKADVKTELGKAKWYLKLFNLGKKAYNNNLGEGIANETVGATVSNMASEALEETSEELLLDISKVMFNAGTSLVGSDTKFDDAFKNAFDRYALSFLGGAVGGGIAGTLPSYRAARQNRNVTQEGAIKEVVDFILQGKDLLLIETVDKMTFGNKYIDEEGNLVDDYSKSLDYMIKQNFKRLVSNIKDILNVNGANLDEDSLLKELGPKDIRYGMFSALAMKESNAIGWYLNRYNELSSLLVLKSLELKNLNESKSDSEKREENSEDKAQEKKLKGEIKEIKDELDKFKDGTMSDEFILDALFEMTTKISAPFVATDINRWVEEKTGKRLDELNDAERLKWEHEFEVSRPLRRDLTRLARQVHIQNMEWLSKIIENYNEKYFQSKEGVVNNLEKVIFGDKASLDPEEVVPQLENYLALNPENVNQFLKRMLESILYGLDKTLSKLWFEKLEQISKIDTKLVLTLKIDTLPQTIEELENLDDETKINLFETLGKNTSDLDDLIKSYTVEETNEETGETIRKLGENFLKDVKYWEKTAREEQALKFNSTLIAFLSNEDIKNEIIKRLSSAKYVSPSVKQALTDFFTTTITGYIYDDNWNPKIDEVETYEPEVINLRKGLVKEYLDSFKDKPSSPVDEYLNNIVVTLKSKGIQISPLIANMEELVSKLAKARNLESFSYTDEIEKTIDQALLVIELAEVGLDSAATSINGDLSDAFGFNVSVNEIREKRGVNKEKLATIPSDVAEGIKLDILRYKQSLLEFKTIQAYNSNQALKEHDKSFKVQNINLYNKIKDFVEHLEPGDWKELNKLKEAVEKSEFENLLEEENINYDYKEKITNARLSLDKAVHNFFKANEDKLFNFKNEEDRKNSIILILKLLKALNFQFSLEKDNNTVINSEEKSLPDKDLLWYLASMAAADPTEVMSVYSRVISSQYAPVIGQEEAIRTATSFLINPKVFKLFADSYNENILEKANSDENYRKNLAPYLLINAFRSIFIEGLPGAGKSTAVLKTITDIIHEIDPNKLKKVIVVSNSKENSNRLAEGLKFAETSEVQTFGIEEFKSKIMNNYKTFDVDSTGAIKIEKSDVKRNTEKQAFEYSNFSLNSDGLDGTFLIIDEATSLSQMDALMVDLFQEAKGIYGLYAGDFDQIGLSGRIKIDDEHSALITQDATNYISTHKLGLVIRGNNTYKSDNTVKFRINKYQFAKSLESGQKLTPVSFSYYLDNTGVYGDVVAKRDKKTTSSGEEYDLDQGTKDIIDTMISTLNEGEKINYIFDSEESEMYKYLTSKYSDKINQVSTKAAQSLEGLYYIVDITVRDNLLSNASGQQEALNSFKNLYTAMSRAKQATLIYDRSNDEIISNRINSIRQLNLVRSNIGLEARAKYAEERVKAIENSVSKESTNLSFNWENESYKNPKKDPVLGKDEGKDEGKNEGEDEGDNEEDTRDEEIDVKNNPKEVDIKNESDTLLNMMIHSFNTHECGGIINDKGELELSERHGERIDNAHGIIKALGLNVTDGKLSVEDTNKVLKILHESRRAGLYEDTPNKVESKIRKAFGLKSNDSIEVNFIYKNSQKSFEEGKGRGAISKFFKGIKDRLMYLFNIDANEKIETPLNRTIGLEIFINGQQIEIPIGTLTSPITLMETKGFEKLKEIYVNSGEDLRNFEIELNRIKEDSIRTGNNPNIPHLDSMIKLLEIYLWNYNHTTPSQNFVIRFNKDFVLNSGRITGIQTPPVIRGLNYKDKDYLYKGRRISLNEYRRGIPNRKISDIYENLGEDIKDNEGNVVLEHGVPFILVSDYYDSKLNDLSLYEQYIKQIKNGEPPLITRVYVYLPTESIDYFLYNLQEALKGDELKSANDIDNSIGNKLTSYRLLSFMLLNDSNFMRTFTDYIDNSKGVIPFNEELKESSKKRILRLLEIVKYINEHENSLTENYSQGSKSKQILNFLNLTPEAIKSQHPELYKLFWGNSTSGTRNIGDTKWTIRTILLYEFRKLLFSGLYYEDKNSSPSLHGLKFEIEKGTDESFIYKDFLLDRISALKKDAEKNNWTGVMFHSSLERESEMVASYGSESYKIARINAEGSSFISNRPIEINGKLDSTAVIRNVEPMLDEILSKLVLAPEDSRTKERRIKATSSITSNLSDVEKYRIYDENTGAYLNGKPRNNIPDIKLQLLNEAINLLDSSSRTPEIINRLKQYVETNTTITPRNLLNILIDENAVIELNGKVKVIKFPDNFLEVLVRDNDETYYLGKDGRIYVASTGTSIEDVDILSSLLQPRTDDNTRQIIRGATEAINKRIQKLSNPQQDLFDENYLNSIFGEGVINLTDFLNFINGNKSLLNKFNAIEVSEDGNTKFNIENYLIAYLSSKGRKPAEIKKLLVELLKLSDLNSKLNYLGYNIDLQKLQEILSTLNQVINNDSNSCIKINK